MTEIGHGTENPPISPIAILLSHADNEVLDFVGGAWPTGSALGTAVILLGNQLAVPSLRIPKDVDRRSELMVITIPKLCR